MSESEQFWSDTTMVIRYIIPVAHPGNFQAGTAFTINGDAQTVLRPDGTVEVLEDEEPSP
jgi:hypothetical protein